MQTRTDFWVIEQGLAGTAQNRNAGGVRANFYCEGKWSEDPGTCSSKPVTAKLGLCSSKPVTAEVGGGCGVWSLEFGVWMESGVDPGVWDWSLESESGIWV